MKVDGRKGNAVQEASGRILHSCYADASSQLKAFTEYTSQSFSYTGVFMRGQDHGHSQTFMCAGC